MQDHNFFITCSITSGAIQQGVPTKVCLRKHNKSKYIYFSGYSFVCYIATLIHGIPKCIYLKNKRNYKEAKIRQK